MKNRYRVDGHEVIIFLDRIDGSQIETRVSRRHLPLLLSTAFKFFASWDQGVESYYVLYHTKNKNGRDTVRSLHRLLMNPPRGMVVDHWNKDTLNNLDSNLKVVTPSQNLQNRNTIHPTNTVGYKGVSYCSRTRKFIAQIKFDKKHIWLGRHETAEEAHKVYMDYRRKSKIHVNTEVVGK